MGQGEVRRARRGQAGTGGAKLGVAGLQFWQRLLLWMFDTASPYWNLLWGIFIALGAFSFGLGIWLLNKRIKQGRITA